MTVAVLLPFGPIGPAGERNRDFVRHSLQQAGFDVHLTEEHLDVAWRRLACDCVWFHDPDLWLPFERVRLPEGAPAFKPFWGYRALDQAETLSLLEGALPEPASQRVLGTTFGKGSFVLAKDVLEALGGLSRELHTFDELGFELSRRVRHFFPQIECSELCGLHLFRARSPAERDRTEADRRLRRQLSEQPVAESTSLRKLVRQEALRAVRPTPPARRPAQLHGRLWALTCYFNPEGYRSKKANYDRFRAALGAPLCTVELAFGEQPFELTEKDADHLIQLRGADVLWQKERLLNLGLQALPRECDRVAWLDCDILFERPDWAGETARLLQEYVVVQPFSLSVRLLPEETRVDTEDLPLGSAEHQVLHSVAYGVRARGLDSLARYHEHGHTGYAWAARREALTPGLYDANILGNADLNIAQAMFAGCRYLKTDRLSPAARRHLMLWAERFYVGVKGSVAPLEGTLFHQWHGSKDDRLYHGRLQVLIEHDFDPVADLAVGDNGAYRWASDKPELHRWCREYFAMRREDGP